MACTDPRGFVRLVTPLSGLESRRTIMVVPEDEGWWCGLMHPSVQV